MLGRAGTYVSGLLLVLSLSGCPVTDDYFVDASAAASEAGAASNGGAAGGVAANAGSGGRAQGGSGPGPGPMPKPADGGMPAMGGMPMTDPGCVPATERCNGHDDNCNDVVDEQACNSSDNGTTGCAGFVVAGRPDHGYMLCTTAPKDYAEAQLACQQQSMRLAWLETEDENTQVTAKVKALTSDEAWIGASDAAAEGEWLWDGAGGVQFWQGNEKGETIDGAFAAWMDGTPNDDNGGEDCAVLQAMTGLWGDRSCSTRYAYLCEEPEQ